MSAITQPLPLLAEDLSTVLRCPTCQGLALSYDGRASVVCGRCGAQYPIDTDAGVCSLLPADTASGVKGDIQKWWGDLYKQFYAPTDAWMTAEKFSYLLTELEDFFRISEHLPVVEMPLYQLSGKRVLEIGSGSGAHSALFKKYGADMISVDITPERVVGTAGRLALISEGKGRAYQADAENLPFKDGAFDIVYSNGVLHHSENTEACLDEVYRVLKPGGSAVLMLYSRHSMNVWFNIYPRGILTGLIFRHPEAEWMGMVTEGKPKHGDVRNPITRVYSKREIERLLHRFRYLELRKGDYEFDCFAIPRLTQFRRWMMTALGFRPHPGGIPIAGVPRLAMCAPERAIGRVTGFSWNIRAYKPDNSNEQTKN